MLLRGGAKVAKLPVKQKKKIVAEYAAGSTLSCVRSCFALLSVIKWYHEIGIGRRPAKKTRLPSFSIDKKQKRCYNEYELERTRPPAG